ncbi:hypothetical protein BGZ51_008194 [Haplosporangium sp. Z 767]|nr:hypothetical protein BGZ51_008194 [Haplosporangium sp. Z 767]
MEKSSEKGFYAVDIPEVTDTEGDSNKPTTVNSREDPNQQKPTITADIPGDAIKNPTDCEFNSEVEALDLVSNTDNVFQSNNKPQPTVARWYFVPDPKNDRVMDAGKDSKGVLKFRCTIKNRPSIQVEVSKRFTEWRTDVSKLRSGLYDIVLGVSTQALNIELIESIAFSAEMHGENEGSRETIVGQELTRMCTSGCGVRIWKLHGQLLIVADDSYTDDDEDDNSESDKSNGNDSENYSDEDEEEEDDSAAADDDGEYSDPSRKLTIRMTITTSTESSIIAHYPYIWSLNVKKIGIFLDGSVQHVPEKILAFAISGNGRYVATMASTGSLNHFLLVVWDLQDPAATSTDIGAAKTSHKQEELSSSTPPLQPRACAVAVIPRPEPVSYAVVDSFRISLSWDGSKVSIAAWIDYVQGSPRSIFSVYCHDRDVPHSQKTPPKPASTAMTILRPSTDHQHCAELENFYGYGVFHITDSANPDVQRELFIAWDHERIHIYRVYCQWSHLRTITAVPQDAFWHIGVQGQYLTVAETEYSVLLSIAVMTVLSKEPPD